jgi:hypothetical protein
MGKNDPHVLDNQLVRLPGEERIAAVPAWISATPPDLFFTNILDKGYRCIFVSWRSGGQLLLQPFFARSNRKFSSREVLLSGAVAIDRSDNDRPSTD